MDPIGVLSGHVTQQGSIVEGAYVRVHGSTGDFVSEARTDDQGFFTFNLPYGNWFVVAFAPGTNRVTVEIPLELQAQDLTIDLEKTDADQD